MTLRAWSLFYDRVLPDLKGSPATALVDQAAVEVARDFCNRTWAHHVDLPAVNAVANQATYALVTPDPTNIEVSCVQNLWHDSKELDQKSSDELAEIYTSRWKDQSGTPRYFTQEDLTAIILAPYPIAALASGIKIHAALMPTLAATGLIDVIYDGWAENIADGIRAKLLLKPMKPWSNPELGGYYEGLYEEAVMSAKTSAANGFVRARRRTKSRFF